MGPMPVASATPAPPLEPPQVSAGFHGFRVAPKTALNVLPPAPNSGVLVLPRTMAPATSSRSTMSESSSGTWSSKTLEPQVVLMPLVWVRSLIVTGTPWSGPRAPFFLSAVVAVWLLERGFPRESHDGVELRIDGVHAREHRLHHLERRSLARAVEALELGGGREAEISVGHAASSATG